MAEDENFARRWSRRKQAVREEREREQAAVTPGETNAPAAAESAGAPETVPDDLPDIESLGADSDYRAFMREDVPEELRTLALRKLWRSNPLFSIIDGLDEYAEDFTDAALVPKGGITSAYKIGRGYAEEVVEKVTEVAGESEDGDVAGREEPGADLDEERRAETEEEETAGTAEPDPDIAADVNEIKKS